MSDLPVPPAPPLTADESLSNALDRFFKETGLRIQAIQVDDATWAKLCPKVPNPNDVLRIQMQGAIITRIPKP